MRFVALIILPNETKLKLNAWKRRLKIIGNSLTFLLNMKNNFVAFFSNSRTLIALLTWIRVIRKLRQFRRRMKLLFLLNQLPSDEDREQRRDNRLYGVPPLRRMMYSKNRPGHSGSHKSRNTACSPTIVAAL